MKAFRAAGEKITSAMRGGKNATNKLQGNSVSRADEKGQRLS